VTDVTPETELAEWKARVERRSDRPDLLESVVWPTAAAQSAMWAGVTDSRSVAGSAASVYGADVSHYQGANLNVAAMNVRWLWIKATELDGADAQYANNRAKALAAGVPSGPYTFLHPGRNIGKVVARFREVGGPATEGSALPMLDIEIPGFTAGEVAAYVAECRKVFGCSPAIYIAQDIYLQPGVAAAIAGCIKVIPRYGPPPRVPWDVWQYTDKGPGGGDGDVTFSLDRVLVPTKGTRPPPPHGDSHMSGFPNAVAACSCPTGGVWVLGSDGGVGAYQGAPFLGSYPGLPPEARQGDRAFLDIEPSRGGYRLLAGDGASYEFLPNP